MKNLVLLTLTFTLSIFFANGQPFNQEVISEGKPPVLLGKINKDVLSENTYQEWFLTNYEAYTPSPEAISTLAENLPQYTITAFFGTWCGDSKKELPRFYKILEAANFPLERLTVVGVARDRDNYKQSPGGEEEGLNIHRVPTFIMYKNGKEVDRIVEHPVETLEKDLVKIIQDNAYTPNYNSVTIVNDALEKMGTKKFNRKAKRLLPKLKKEVKSLGELNTYSSVLFFSDRKEEAITVARLNIKLFPKKAYPYENLANKLYQTNKIEEAMKNYQLSLGLDPKNKRVKETIKKIEQKDSK